MTGDLLGTLRYMSPEQAQGKRVPLDHRTDIYSLAVTLYELLTLRQAFPGDDQAAVIRDVASREPIRPRVLNPATPAELETILLKAMAKEPVDRYATAQELADDLRRFIDDRPIHARRPSALKRAVQWSRRHTAVIWAVGAVLVLAIAGLIAGNFVIANERDQAQNAREAAMAANRVLETNVQEMRGLVEDMLGEVADELAEQPHLEHVRKKLLERALAFYSGLLEREGDRPDVQGDVARAHARVGYIDSLLGLYDRAEEATLKSIEIFEKLAKDHRDDPDLRHSIATGVLQLGTVQRHTGRPADAERNFTRCLSSLSEMSASPEVRHLTAECLTQLGGLLRDTERPAEGQAALGRSRAIYEELCAKQREHPTYRAELALVLGQIAQLQTLSRHFDDAEKAYRRCITLLEEEPVEKRLLRTRTALASTWLGLGNMFSEAWRFDDAVEALRKARSKWTELMREFPRALEYRRQLAGTCVNLGHLFWRMTNYANTPRIKEGREAYGAALDLSRDLANKHPENPTHGWIQGRSHLGLASLCSVEGRLEEALAQYVRGLECLDGLENKIGSQWDYRETRATSTANLALTLVYLDRREEAEPLLRRVIEMERSLQRDFPDVPQHAAKFAGALRNLASGVLEPSGRIEAAEDCYRDEIQIWRKLVDKYPKAVRFRGGLVGARRTLASFYSHTGRQRKAEEEYRGILDELEANQQGALPKALAGVLNEIAWFFATCADHAVRDPHLAVKLAERAIKLAGEDAASWNTLGVARYRAGQWKGAVDALDRSRELGSMGQPAIDYLFLAMANWQLGEKKQAHTWYRKGVEAMGKQPSNDPELASFRTEAEALLGVPQGSPTDR